MLRKIIALSFILVTRYGFSQNSTVDSYIRLGLDKNLSLKQKNLNLQQSFDYLKIANGMFYPSLKFQSNYTYAAGGRNISLPLGDLLNPAYKSLNELTGTSNFPNVQNQEFNLSANDYYDNKLSVMLPLINAEIGLNKKIRKEAITQTDAEIAVFKRGLVRDIKIAYYTIARIQSEIEIFENADKLLQDNYKITQARVRNGKTLQGNSLRILSDINDNKAKLTDAQNRLKTGNAYLNFLTNEDLIKQVIVDTTGFREHYKNNVFVAEYPKHEREEMIALRSQLSQADLTIKLRKAAYLPVMNTFLDAGFQSTYLQFNPDARYLLGGVSLKWDLFSGFQNKNKINAAQIDASIFTARIQENDKLFQYQQITAENTLASATEQLASSSGNLVFLEEYYRETKSRYDQGMVLLVELNDAFTQLINGRLKYELANTDVLIRKAELERTTASYQLNPLK